MYACVYVCVGVHACVYVRYDTVMCAYGGCSGSGELYPVTV